MKKITLLAFFVFLSRLLFANTVPTDNTLLIAKTQLETTNVKLVDTKYDSKGNPLFRIYNREINGIATGFIIISADSISEPILAYSNESGWVVGGDDNFHNSIYWWSHDKQKEISLAIANNVTPTKAILDAWNKASIVTTSSSRATSQADLLKDKYNQGPPFNTFCPRDSSINGYPYAQIGCVATVAGQMSNFFNSPSQLTGGLVTRTYWVAGKQYTTTFNCDTIKFDWNKVPDIVNSTNYQEIARFFAVFGKLVQMDYSYWSSGAYVFASGSYPTAQKVYIDNLGFDPNSLKKMMRNSTPADVYLTTIKTELSTYQRPVQMVGYSGGWSGHTWVADGFDENDYLHMNFGWGGAYNGYYKVTAVTAAGYNFVDNQGILYGFKPLGTPQPTCNPTTLKTTLISNAVNVTLSWNTSPDAISYILEYKKNSDATWTTLNTTNTSHTLSNLPYSTAYTFKVTSVCSIGNSLPVTGIFTTGNTPCGVAPSIQVTNVDTSVATILWGVASGATSYSLQYKKNTESTFTTVSTTTPSVKLTNLTPSTTYNVRITTNCQQSSITSSIFSFNTLTPAPPVPQDTVVIPSAYCKIKGNSAFEYIKSININNTVVNSGNNGGYLDSTSLLIPLSPTTKFEFTPGYKFSNYVEYWAVYIDINKDNVFQTNERVYLSPWKSGMQLGTFTVPSFAGTTTMRVIMSFNVPNPCSISYGEAEDYIVSYSSLNVLENSFQLRVFPNPATNNLTISYIPTSLINIYTSNGQVITSFTLENAIQTIDIYEYPSGIYFLEATIEDRKQIIKLLIQK